MKKPFAFILSVITVLFLIFSPQYIRSGLTPASSKDEKFEGILTLWHITGLETGGESAYSFVKNRVSAFEKENPRVFINSEAMSAEEANERISNGEHPDIISYPMGFAKDPSVFAELERPALSNAFALTGTSNGVHFAYPYMCGFYTLVCSESIFSAAEVTYPIDIELSHQNFYYAMGAFDKCPLAVSSGGGITCAALMYPVLSDDPTFAEDYSEQPFSKYNIEYIDGSKLFSDGGAAMLICPFSEYCKMRSSGDSDKNAFLISGYTDLIQFVSVFPCENALKSDACSNFAAFLLSEKSQKRLEPTYMLPVTDIEEIYADDPLITSAYQYGIFAVPSEFSYASSDSLGADAQAAITGNESAKVNFEQNTSIYLIE